MSEPTSDITVQPGLLVRFDAAHGKEANVNALLREAVDLVQDEPGTLAWYGLRFGRHEFGIFDAFADEAAREAHVEGPIADALLDARPALDGFPSFDKLRVLAHKSPTTTAHAHKGLLLTFRARAGHEADVERFLCDALPLVEEEPGTIAWYAIQRAHGGYGIFDVFPDNGARFAHLTGHVPRELAKHATHLLGGMPEMHMLDVVAERV
jgi:quinol monooxygenase YgiN